MSFGMDITDVVIKLAETTRTAGTKQLEMS
jgi:hypothetical protein